MVIEVQNIGICIVPICSWNRNLKEGGRKEERQWKNDRERKEGKGGRKGKRECTKEG